MKSSLQMLYQDVFGKDSPIQQALKFLRNYAYEGPMPNSNADQSQSAAALILTHVLGVFDGVGLINSRGCHSAAIALFRTMEDATDCFAAVA